MGFLNSHWKCSVAAAAAVLLFAVAALLLAAAAVAVTGLAQCTGSRDLTRQSVALSPDLLVQLAAAAAAVVVVVEVDAAVVLVVVDEAQMAKLAWQTMHDAAVVEKPLLPC